MLASKMALAGTGGDEILAGLLLPSSACRAVGQMERGGGSDREKEHAGSFAHLGRGSGARPQPPAGRALSSLHGIARGALASRPSAQFRPTARITPTMRQ